MCVYTSLLKLSLHFPSEANTRWFTLCRKPDRTLTNSSGYLLVPVSSPQSHPPQVSVYATVGSIIYHFGSDIGALASSSVSVLDCRSHTWREAPSLNGERKMYPSSACVFGEKIYVAIFNLDDESEPWESMEVLDTKTQIWDHVPIPSWDGYDYLGLLTRSTCIEGKVYLKIKSKVLAYDPEEGRWDFVEQKMGESWNCFLNCTIENVFYSYNYGALEWYDNKVRVWKQIKGLSLRGMFKFVCHHEVIGLADYGGKMAVLWYDYEPDDREEKMIWCAVIALERHNSEEIFGKVEWCNLVLTVPFSTQFGYALAATV